MFPTPMKVAFTAALLLASRARFCLRFTGADGLGSSGLRCAFFWSGHG